MPHTAASSFSELRYDDSFVRSLPGDPNDAPSPRIVRGVCYSPVRPTRMPDPQLLAWSRSVAAGLGLDAERLAPHDLARLCGGNDLPLGMRPYAACYGGHQFGNWAGQLGDGRAITLGEVLTPAGGRAELQLKGAGRTAYSRSADGRAVLRSSIREYLASEAMHALGVPTTRALCLVSTGEQVLRDILYDGHPAHEPGAIVCRVAPSFVRFGNFEIFAARREHALLKGLADWVLTHHYPELGAPGTDSYVALFREVCLRTARLFVELMRVGFVHGVLNTDNMSILGLAIDYGPFGFLDVYDPDFTPNTTDAYGRRYRFGQQPLVAQWNLARLGSALLPLVGDASALEASLAEFAQAMDAGMNTRWANKLGLARFRDEGDGAGDRLLVRDLEAALVSARADMPRFFRWLGRYQATPVTGDALAAALADVSYTAEAEAHAPLVAWLERYRARLAEEGGSAAERARAMDAVNPKYVLRNFQAQLAIDAAEAGDLTRLHTLERVLARPYDEQPEAEAFADKRPDWAETRPGCGMLSCSS
jgi:serine/tyrosine/threonine adenylyltransferase